MIFYLSYGRFLQQGPFCFLSVNTINFQFHQQVIKSFILFCFSTFFCSQLQTTGLPYPFIAEPFPFSLKMPWNAIFTSELPNFKFFQGIPKWKGASDIMISLISCATWMSFFFSPTVNITGEPCYNSLFSNWFCFLDFHNKKGQTSINLLPLRKRYLAS